MISIENGIFSYGEKVVLDGVNLKIADGEFVGLIGRNGAGKTTLLKVLMGIVKLQSGRVVNTFKKSAFLSQVTGNLDMLFPATVKEVVSLGLKWKPCSFMRRADWQKVDAALAALDVLDLKDRSIGELSGGQQQRVRLAKALISDPDLLVMDEPTTGMDAESRQEFLQQTIMLNKKMGKTIILVSHFMSDMAGTDRIVYLSEGKILPHAPYSSQEDGENDNH